MKVLITGVAGFIGHAVAGRLSERGYDIVGIDNLNNYYDVALKYARLTDLEKKSNIHFKRLDISNKAGMDLLFQKYKFNRVIHLAAQAGVRYSLDNPHVYAESNLVGYLNVLEGCRRHNIEHLVFASSSSVYGMNENVPFKTSDAADHPISLYAATKKANELMTHSYSHLYNLPATGLRFFTVYGPWGRPDMAPFKFIHALLKGYPIEVFNYGKVSRDFTYIDDIVDGIIKILNVIPKKCTDTKSPDRSTSQWAIYNIGYGNPVSIMDFINAMEKATGVRAQLDFKPMQPGDVSRTWADTAAFYEATSLRPKIDLIDGVNKFVKWYRKFYKL